MSQEFEEKRSGKEPKEQEGGIERGSWSGTAQFFITSLGSAVGLGNVWRFPNIVYKNGGAAFLIAYVLALIFIAIPILLLEATIGQYSKKGPIGVWDLAPVFRGIGFATLWSTFCFIIYYNTPLAWAAYYFVNSMTADLPWKTCTSDTCRQNNGSGAAEDFFYNNTLKLSTGVDDWGEFSWQLYLCNAVIWVLLYAGICLGAASLGKIAYFTSLFPYVMLTIMIGYTATLEGASVGVEFYITKFEWEKLQDIGVWRAAIAQVFFSTNCALGTVIQLSSYNKFRQNIYRDAIIIPICDGITSIFAGFSVFTVLGYMSVKQNVPIEEVVVAGPGLIFITYPEAFAIIDGGNIWSVFFFFMVMVLGVSSQLPMIEMCCGVLSDLISAFSRSRLRNLMFRFGFVLLCLGMTTFFYFGFGYYWYYLVDERVSGIPLIIISIFELIGVGWFYSKPLCLCRNTLLKNIEEMVGRSWSTRYWRIWSWSKYYWVICWTVIAPFTLIFIFIYDLATMQQLIMDGYVFPDWAVAIGWAIIAVSPLLILAGMIMVPCYQYRGYQAWLNSLRPLAAWKAARDSLREPRNNDQILSWPAVAAANAAKEINGYPQPLFSTNVPPFLEPAHYANNGHVDF